MPVTAVIVKKVSKGAPAPDGFTFVRTTRAGDIYQKTESRSTVDDLVSMFSSFGVGTSAAAHIVTSQPAASQVVQQIQTSPEEQLLAALGNLSIGGRRRRKTRKGGVPPVRSADSDKIINVQSELLKKGSLPKGGKTRRH